MKFPCIDDDAVVYVTYGYGNQPTFSKSAIAAFNIRKWCHFTYFWLIYFMGNSQNVQSKLT